MFTGIPLSQIKTRPLIEIPRPQPVLGSDGRPQLRDNKPLFNVKAAPIDFMMSKVNPVKTFFSERFIIDPKQRAKPVEIAVFFYLANTTEWSNVEIIINGDGQPIFTTDGNGQA
ncbi:hypothetical protein [Shinella zoogloeoides]|uniref:hypothetical protein n=1 Tax=Shinella zoogloeoides TaxID=352475 RepID=UPI001F5A252C|nr:hypothetical protein [Shinella zoogloeoides]